MTRLVRWQAVDVLSQVQEISGAAPSSVRDCFSDYFSNRRPGNPVEIALAEITAIVEPAQNETPTQNPSTVLQALQHVGVIAEVETADGRAIVRLADDAFAAHCYSYTLQRQAGEVQLNAFPDWTAERLREIFEVPITPLAMLMWLDRIVDEPDHEERIATLVKALVTSPYLRREVVFSWAPPRLIRPIFLGLHAADDDAYLYRQAMAAVPPTPETSAFLRHYLHDQMPQVCITAVELCGLRRDPDAVPRLMDMLSVEDDEVQRAVILALTRTGRSLIPSLGGIAQNGSQDERSRAGALAVLGAIGSRTPGVSFAIGACLRDGRERPVLMRAGLRAAARLRDTEHRHVAQFQAQSSDESTALAAVQLLMEIPGEDAVPGINSAIEEWRSRTAHPFQSHMIKLLYETLAKCGGSPGRNHVLNQIQLGLNQ